jgi:hypothetical protein
MLTHCLLCVAAAIADLEDFGGTGSVSKSGIASVTNYRPGSTSPTSTSPTSSTAAVAEEVAAVTEQVAVIALNELPDGKHANKGEFDAWLADRKSRWRTLRQARRQARKELLSYGTGNGLMPGAKKAVGVADLVRNASLAATLGFWQVRSVCLHVLCVTLLDNWSMTTDLQVE